MEQDLSEKLEAQEKRLEEIHKSIEKMRKYFLWSLVINVLTIVLPLTALAAIVPWFLRTIASVYGLG